MAKHNDLGRIGEEKVYHYLLENGYVVLERNWRVGRKELDFVALRDEVLVIVEVKTRSTPEEYPGELLSRKKRRNLLAAGEAYLLSRGMNRELRVDLLLVTGEELKIEHLPDAVTLW